MGFLFAFGLLGIVLGLILRIAWLSTYANEELNTVNCRSRSSYNADDDKLSLLVNLLRR